MRARSGILQRSEEGGRRKEEGVRSKEGCRTHHFYHPRLSPGPSWRAILLHIHIPGAPCPLLPCVAHIFITIIIIITIITVLSITLLILILVLILILRRLILPIPLWIIYNHAPRIRRCPL